MFPIVQMSRPKHDEVSGLSGLVSCACRTLDGGDRKPVRITPVVVGEGGKEGESPAASPHLPASWSPGLLEGEASGAYQAWPKVGGLGCVPGPQVVPRPGRYWS